MQQVELDNQKVEMDNQKVDMDNQKVEMDNQQALNQRQQAIINNSVGVYKCFIDDSIMSTILYTSEINFSNNT